ncbi:hypothetical protein D9M73_133450 [compost metagenome]
MDLAEAHARHALAQALEIIVVEGHLQHARVFCCLARSVGAADQERFVMAEEIALRNRDEIAELGHVDQPVMMLHLEVAAGVIHRPDRLGPYRGIQPVDPCAIAEGAVVDPDMRRIQDRDQIIGRVPAPGGGIGRVPLREEVERIFKSDVAHHDIVDRCAAGAEDQVAVDELGIAAQADDRGVRRHEDLHDLLLQRRRTDARALGIADRQAGIAINARAIGGEIGGGQRGLGGEPIGRARATALDVIVGGLFGQRLVDVEADPPLHVNQLLRRIERAGIAAIGGDRGGVAVERLDQLVAIGDGIGLGRHRAVTPGRAGAGRRPAIGPQRGRRRWRWRRRAWRRCAPGGATTNDSNAAAVARIPAADQRQGCCRYQ